MLELERVGVFGGTFDPVHVGHLIIAEILRHRLALSRIIFLPAGRPPHKSGQALAADEDRINMLALSTDGSPHFSISTIDMDRAGPSYTADSLRMLREQIGHASELYFLMGQDSLRDFPSWHRPDLIARLARVGVALRPGVEVSIDEITAAVPDMADRIELVTVPLIGISSRELRAEIRAGGPYRYQVLPTVANYIVERCLYQANGVTDSSHPPVPD